MRVNLMNAFNSNAFTKVNVFGPDLQVWFKRDTSADYYTDIGKLQYWGDDTVILHLKLKLEN